MPLLDKCNSMLLYPKAKINLGLNVVERRPDGYHNIETVFVPINLTDTLEVNILPDKAPGQIDIKVEGVNELCPVQNNLVYKAYALLNADFPLPAMEARLVKNIPSQAGLGGGSSDGAYMLRAINELCSLGLSNARLQQYAAKLGADCPLFITAETAYATGIGDILTPMEIPALIPSGRYYLALIKPPVAVSTKEAYSGITPQTPQQNCRDIVKQPIEMWKDLLHNDFEDSVFSKLPVLAEVKQGLYDSGAIYAAMSGSGSTVFGIFDNSTPNLQSLLNNTTDAYSKIIPL